MIQKHEVIGLIMRQYASRTPINRRGIEIMYHRAESRGYDAQSIYRGLKTVICKNYLREEYTPPRNDPMLESLDERHYIDDWDFREIRRGGVKQ